MEDYQRRMIDTTLCPGESITVNGVIYDMATTTSDTFPAPMGCDSIVDIMITMEAYQRRMIDTTLCPGESITVNGVVYDMATSTSDTFPAPIGCDSIVDIMIIMEDYQRRDIDTTLCPGESITVNGVVYDMATTISDTFPAPIGCDSIVNINILFEDYQRRAIDTSICVGEAIIINGISYDMDTILSDTFPAPMGCDSIVSLTLNVEDYQRNTIDTSICAGDVIIVNGVTYSSDTIVSDTFPAPVGCDSIVALTLTVEDYQVLDIDTSICAGESILINGVSYNTDTIVSDTFAAPIGCDSIINLILVIEDFQIQDIDTSICAGESILINGITYNTDTIVSDTFAAPVGCDSIINLTLVVEDFQVANIDTSICDGESIIINGTAYTSDTIVSDTFPAPSGCDSIVNLTLDVIDLIIPTFDPIGPICPNDPAVNLPTTSTNGVDGSWSGTGVSGNTFDPTVGTQDIVFAPDASNDCADSLTITIVVDPAVCPCQIDTVIVTDIVCDDNGTPTDPSDDTYTFNVEVQGSNTAPTWTITLPDATTVSGNYNSPTPVGPLNIADGPVNLTAVDDNLATCSFNFTVEPPMTCSSDCIIDTIIIENMICNDNGTPSDPTDDTFTFDVEVRGSGVGAEWNSSVTLGGNTNHPYNTVIAAGPFNIADGEFNLAVTDVDGGETCRDNIRIIPPMTCSDQCLLFEPIIENITCDPGADPTDPDDDTFTFTITVDGFNLSGSWSADDPNTSVGIYNTPLNLGPYPISGGDLNFTITDMDDPSCSVDVTVVAPPTCSDLCQIQDAIISNIVCDPGADPADPADDSFTFEINVSAVNNAAGWTANDPLSSNGNYGTNVVMGPYPISGGDLAFTITDFDDPACTFPIEVAAPEACSDLCVISAVSVLNILCDDNGTPSDPTDDIFTFDVNVSGLNTSTWSAGDLSGELYGEVVTFGPFDIADGTQFFTIIDDNDPDCSFDIEVEPPETCSPECEITDVIIDLILCDDNGTPSDPTDDLFTFELEAIGFNLAPFGWFATDPNATSGVYNNITGMGPYRINQSPLNFRLVDLNNSTCFFNVEIDQQEPCSDACNIEDVEIINIICDDQGTDNDPTDDTYTFELIANAINSAPGWNANDPSFAAGNYGDTILMGPYLIANGDLSFTIRDNAAPNSCNFEVNVTAPPSCSFPCAVTSIDLENVVCDYTNGTLTFDLFVQGENNSETWIANDPNNTTGEYNTNVAFGPFNINQAAFFISITDAMDDDCLDSILIDPMALCPPCRLNEPVVSELLCNNNGTPDDPTDDTFTFNVTISGDNVASDWTADDPLATVGNYNTPVAFGPFNIADGNFNISFTDNVDPNCSTSIEIIPPATCSGDQCAITNVVVQDTICFDNGTPADASDDTYTFNLLVEGNNTAVTWTANDINSTQGNYGGLTAFGPFNIADGNLSLTITDDNDPDCSIDITVVPPQSCSPESCMISNIEVFDTICNDNGTPDDATDDTFTFNIRVNGNNTGMTWQANDPALTQGNYGEVVAFGPFNINNGNFDLTIADLDNEDCNNTVSIVPLQIVSITSILKIVHSIEQVCGGTIETVLLQSSLSKSA
ncbi:MAG: hypothetical protein AAGK97_01170, partial [Bacteroidota bacterium]